MADRFPVGEVMLGGRKTLDFFDWFLPLNVFWGGFRHKPDGGVQRMFFLLPMV
jgi:hypothetical protein